MANMSNVMHGQVEYVENGDTFQYNDDAGACRLKVRLDSDGKDKATKDLPYALPLLPATIHSIPKKGEGVYIVTDGSSETESQRYYIGPIISQPQFQEKCEYNKGKGDAVSLNSTAKPLKNKPLTSINRAKKITKGSFPEVEDVSLIGRGQEDIILKYRHSDENLSKISEIDLRTGIRVEPSDNSIDYLKGNVVFNHSNPGFIQIKYGNNGLSGLRSGSGDFDPNKYESIENRAGKSVVNVVADKINLISHKDSNQFGQNITDADEMVTSEKLDEIMSQLHRAVYGDELVTLLKLIVKALKTHVHHISTMEPDPIALEGLTDDKFEKILSPNVRIS